jgi:Flp pilus assembly protein TadD
LRTRCRDLIAAIALAVSACARSPLDPAPVTFNRDVAPILFSRCASCHRPGEVAPFTLLTYDDARPRAAAIARATASRQMPPWLPDPGDPPFLDERRLSASEIDTLTRWAEQGAVQGDARDLPAAPSWPSGWMLGTPDLVVTLAQPYLLQPGMHDVYRNVVMPVTVPANRFVRAVEFSPGTRAVHHAVIRIDRTGVSRRLDAGDGQPGFDGMVATDVQDPSGHFIGWAPGRGPIVAPARMPWRLDRGADLVVELHLMPPREPVPVKPTIALYFTDTPPADDPVMLIMGSKAIDIPAGAENYEAEDRYQLPVAVDVLSLYPHAHYLGREMLVEAHLPDGTVRHLLHIPRWNFQWQQDYRFSTPVPLPQGTTFAMRYTYDNSERNAANPHRPIRRVTWGPQSSDEMATLGVQVLPRSTADAALLTASFDRHAAQTDVAGAEVRLRVDPDNAGNELNVGSSYIHVGRVAEAVPHLERALRLDPRLASAENFLGGALFTLGNREEAARHFRRAVALAPRDEHLRFNLGRMLAMQGDRSGAAAQFQQALTINPDLAEAHQELGVLLFEQRRLPEAIDHLTAAARLAPQSSTAQAALGGALAQAGRLEEAVTRLQQALTLDPSNSAARENLARIRAR